MYYGDGSYAYTISVYCYGKEAINNVNKYMKDEKMEFNKKLSVINYSPKNTYSAV